MRACLPTCFIPCLLASFLAGWLDILMSLDAETSMLLWDPTIHSIHCPDSILLNSLRVCLFSSFETRHLSSNINRCTLSLLASCIPYDREHRHGLLIDACPTDNDRLFCTLERSLWS